MPNNSHNLKDCMYHYDLICDNKSQRFTRDNIHVTENASPHPPSTVLTAPPGTPESPTRPATLTLSQATLNALTLNHPVARGFSSLTWDLRGPPDSPSGFRGSINDCCMTAVTIIFDCCCIFVEVCESLKSSNSRHSKAKDGTSSPKPPVSLSKWFSTGNADFA